MVLEFSQYLENYLWPNYTKESSYSHMLSIVIMVNEKFRERVQVWQVSWFFLLLIFFTANNTLFCLSDNIITFKAFKKRSEYFPDFFQQVLKGCFEDELLINIKEQTALLVFLNHCFNSMEEALCRDQVKRLVSLSMWISLQPARREYEFKNFPKWKKYWRAIHRKDKPDQVEKLTWERTFLHRLMLKFLDLLDTIKEGQIVSVDKVSTKFKISVFPIKSHFLGALL